MIKPDKEFLGSYSNWSVLVACVYCVRMNGNKHGEILEERPEKTHDKFSCLR